MLAVKQLQLSQSQDADDKNPGHEIAVEALKDEGEMLKDLDHPHIVQYLGFEITPSFSSLFAQDQCLSVMRLLTQC
jgi:serine/threonine protein kinase